MTDIQAQIEADDSDLASVSDRVQTEGDRCNIECKLHHLLKQVEEVNQNPLIQTEITPITPPPDTLRTDQIAFLFRKHY